MQRQRSEYDQNLGVPGVVYVLGNPALREGYYKIGCSRASGAKRAEDLNMAASTGMPGSYNCLFEVRTRDCGKAERIVFRKLAAERRGKWGQEFFEVDLEKAKQVIKSTCSEVDQVSQERSPSASMINKASQPPVSADQVTKRSNTGKSREDNWVSSYVRQLNKKQATKKEIKSCLKHALYLITLWFVIKVVLVLSLRGDQLFN